MYLNYYQLEQYPFAMPPNLEIFCRFHTHQQAIDTVLFAIRSKEALVKVTGPVGSGKTLICRLIINQLAATAHIINLANPDVDAVELRRSIAYKLGLGSSPRALAAQATQQITEQLVARLTEKEHVVLVIDEAQLLSDDALEALRLLTNLEVNNQQLLQVILVGQQELDQRLRQFKFRPLAQRISFSCRLAPLKLSEMRYYIDYRLMASGYQGERLFTDMAVRKIHAVSAGIPRIANIIAHKASLLAYSQSAGQVSYPMIHAVIKENPDLLGRTVCFYKQRYLKWGLKITLGVASFCVLYALYFSYVAQL